MFKNFNQKGYIISTVTFVVLIVMLAIALAVSFLVALWQKDVTNSVKSSQSYYAAESGIEDALLRLKKNPQMTVLSYTFSINNATASVNIPSTIGASKTVISESDNSGVKKKIQVVSTMDNTSDVNFYYGVEVGEGGLQMSNGSRVMGNVFSAGNISGSGTIDNGAIVSGNGHSISGVHVRGNALAYSCLSGATIDGNLTYVTGGTHTCAVGGITTEQSEEIAEQPLPIPQSQIDQWKAQAESAQVITGNVTIANGQTRIMGPVKITGSLTISNNATLKMTGTVYVVGNVNTSNNVTVKLDSSYGSLGGVLISDGQVSVSNNVVFSGSGQPGSYLLMISTNTSDSAISINNNTSGAVFYTTSGGLSIANNVSLVEATGYKVIMQNNSTIQYSTGIVHIYFSSGTGGAWKVSKWEEL